MKVWREQISKEASSVMRLNSTFILNHMHVWKKILNDHILTRALDRKCMCVESHHLNVIVYNTILQKHLFNSKS